MRVNTRKILYQQYSATDNISQRYLIEFKGNKSEDDWVPFGSLQAGDPPKIFFHNERDTYSASFNKFRITLFSRVTTSENNNIGRSFTAYFRDLLQNIHQEVNQVDQETVNAFMERYDQAFLNTVDSGVENPLDTPEDLIQVRHTYGALSSILSDTLVFCHMRRQKYLIGRGVVLHVDGNGSITPLVVILTKPKYVDYFRTCMVLEEIPIVESFISVETRDFKDLHPGLYRKHLRMHKECYGSIRAISREKMASSYALTKRFFNTLDIRSNFNSLRERKDWIDEEIEDFLAHAGQFVPISETLEGNVILTP